MAGFTIPDNDVASSPNQSMWMATDTAILTAGFNGVGVISGCAVTAQGSPDMTVAIAAGTIRIASGVLIAVTAAAAQAITTADGTNPRIDLVSSSNAGVKTVTAGTPALHPKAPDLPSGHVGLAMVYVPASDTTISSGQIVDKRFILPTLTYHWVRVYNSTNEALNNATDTFLTFDSERYDTDGYHSTSSATGRLTVPTGLDGLYLIIFHGYTTGTPGVGSNCGIRLNGTTGIAIGALQSTDTSVVGYTVSTMYPLVATDYVEAKLRVNAASKNMIFDAQASGEFQMVRIASL